MKNGGAIDRRTLAFTIPIKKDGEAWTLYIPAPSRERVESVSPILGHIFTIIQSGTPPAVIAQDYEFIAKEACQIAAKRLSNNELECAAKAEASFEQFKSFLQSSLESSLAFDLSKEKSMPISEAGLSGESLNETMGQYVFFYCAYRYASDRIDESTRKEYVTSLSPTDYQKHLETRSSAEEPTQGK